MSKAKKVIYKCLICGFEIEGDGHGTMIWCPCNNIAIDDNGIYYRLAYKSDNYKIIVDEYAKEEKDKKNRK